MTWSFCTDADMTDRLAWMRDFVVREVEPLELLWPHLHHTPPPPWLRKVIDPLKQQVKDRGLWACHLGPELGGQGLGQVNLALMNAILGRTPWAPVIFGAQAPDTGNAEVIARYGSEQQRERYLEPLLDGTEFSCFCMTEPQGGADPTMIRTSAHRDGDGWVLRGEKFFASNASNAAFLLVLAVTEPDAERHRRLSLFLVPGDTPGVEILRDLRTIGEAPGEGMGHAHIRLADVRLPGDALLGERGHGFVMAQVRLNGGRLHHAMRAVGLCLRAYEMMCERVRSRTTRGAPLAGMQLVQQLIAESYLRLEQFRLFILQTAWKIDHEGADAARADIALSKVLAAEVMQDIVAKAIHVHGALGVSNELPLAEMWMDVPAMSLQDGPSEVHLVNAARSLLRDVPGSDDGWPTEWVPRRLTAAKERYAEALEAQRHAEAATRQPVG